MNSIKQTFASSLYNALQESGLKMRQKSAGEILKEEAQIPLYLTKGIVKSSLSLLEQGAPWKAVIESENELRHIFSDPDQASREKKEAFEAIKNEVSIWAKNPSQKVGAALKEALEKIKSKTIGFIKSSKNEQAEKIGEWIPEIMLTLLPAAKVETVSESLLSSIQEPTLKIRYTPFSKSWTTPAGLIYRKPPLGENRVLHVMHHLEPNSAKRIHTVFNVNRKALLPLIDEAWLKRTVPLAHDPSVYLIDMNRVIGTQGETKIRLVVYPETNKIFTAYPVK